LAGLNGRTLEGYYREAVIDLAAQAESAQAQADIAGAQTAQIENRRSETMGVNLDEEMAEMVKLQRTYQAAARALSTMDQITEELLGIVR
jgi:flagellar hook-associated protein 1 FlgK